MKPMIALVAIAFLSYASICAYLFFAQRSMIYYPTLEASSNAATALHIDTGQATVKVWRVGEAKRQGVLYFGGNAEDVSQHIDEFQTAFPDHTVYLAHYRGYGGSSGTPSESGLFHDALYLFDELGKSHDALAVIGRSLGSGVATMLATERVVDKLILVTPFDSISSLAQAAFSWLPVSALIRDRFDSASRAGNIVCPTLVLIAEDDEIIPRRHSNALVGAITQAPLTVVEIDGATHNTIGNSQRYTASIASFLLETT